MSEKIEIDRADLDVVLMDYIVEECIWSERDQTWGFRHFSSHETLADANRVARKRALAGEPRAAKFAVRVLKQSQLKWIEA